MQTKYTDTELITQSLAGNQAAYADLMKRHQRFVFTLALRFARRREDAEEIAQDCFVKAYRSLANFNGESKFSTWLYSIVYTTAMTFLRKKRLDTSSIDDESTYIQLENQFSGLDNNLAERKSRSFYLNYKGEQSLDEIGQAMGMEPSTVKVKLFRARQRLKERLERTLKHEVNELI
jgi:RNA polymerase sigma factor (sigma-70 family)